MPLMTSKEYTESLRSMKHVLYIMGEKVERMWDHPLMKPVINAIALTYDLALDPALKGRNTAISHLTGKEVNRFNHVHRNAEDLMNKALMLHYLTQTHGCCVGARCVGSDGLPAVYDITYKMDKKLGTGYHERFKKWLLSVQEKDLAVSGMATDAKGDRSLRPSQQSDPDVYLRVVKKTDEGIVVRGAKAHQSGAVVAHENLVMPTMGMTEEDKAYAVCFATPSDAPGMVHILEGAAADQRRLVAEEMDYGNAAYGVHGATLVIFDDVFVPWERVFMCEEYEFSGSLVANFADLHRHGFAGCKSGHCSLVAGACAVMADYNGVGKVGHIKEKLNDLVILSQTTLGLGIAAGTLGYTTESGCYFPDSKLVNIAKLKGVEAVWGAAPIAADIAGGIVCTAPTEKDMKHPEIGKYIDKYYRGKNDVSTENRVRMSRLIEFLMGMSSVIPAESSNGGGSSATQRLAIRAAADLKMPMERAKKLAGIDRAG